MISIAEMYDGNRIRFADCTRSYKVHNAVPASGTEISNIESGTGGVFFNFFLQ